jgi:hypothetical protein
MRRSSAQFIFSQLMSVAVSRMTRFNSPVALTVLMLKVLAKIGIIFARELSPAHAFIWLMGTRLL